MSRNDQEQPSPPRRRFLKTLGLVGVGAALVSITKKVSSSTPTPAPEPSFTSTSERYPLPTENYTETLPGGLRLSMIAIPAGSFLMGSPDSDPDARTWEKPQHEVSLGAFHIGQFPVTQEQWQTIMGNNPSLFGGNPQNPVEQVSWDDCQAFCQKLSQLLSKTYRLPSEAEWEYACRAGTTTRYSFGDDPEQLGDHSWYNKNSGGTTHPVGQKKPNPWGLYDVHGNVWEWCADHGHDSYAEKPQSLKDNGNSIWVDSNGSTRVRRGGSSFSYPWDCHSAVSWDDTPDLRDGGIGFRVLCKDPRLS